MSLFLLVQLQLLVSCVVLVSSFGAHFLCNRIPGLTSKQREICETSPDALAAIGEGTQLGIQECQHQFRFHRWNCTPFGDSFGHIAVIGSREAAFLYAISSAGVTFAITQACARGNISSCGCAPPTTISTSSGSGSGIPSGSLVTTSGKDNWGVSYNWRWGGCSADVNYAIKLSRKFLDSREIEGDARSLMNLHNNKAGRRVVQSTLGTDCKCHGVSGSCTLKTCWLKLPTFRRVGEVLLDKYKRAKPVIAIATATHPRNESSAYIPKSNFSSAEAENAGVNTRPRRSLILVKYKGYKDAHRLAGATRPKHHQQRSVSSQPAKPRRSDLVFLDPSPNYCELDSRTGSLGTRLRRCFHRKQLNSSRDEQSCDILCCGRGYNTHQMWRQWKCKCKFHWCCEVHCEQCQEKVEIYTCK